MSAERTDCICGHSDLAHGAWSDCCQECDCDHFVSVDDYDPTPWCSGCGAMKKKDCHCGPLAAND